MWCRWESLSGPNDRFGSKGDLSLWRTDVRYVPNSGSRRPRCLLLPRKRTSTRGAVTSESGQKLKSNNNRPVPTLNGISELVVDVSVVCLVVADHLYNVPEVRIGR